MTTASQQLFTINGALSTNKTVWQNLDSLAVACNSFITFDINQGKWCVIINKPGSSTISFNDSNIIGGINISGTGLTNFYNQVQISFPHKDLVGRTDTVIAKLDSSQWYPNEQSNVLNISTDLTNDPVQAEVIGITQLKQSRIDNVIQFQTDFSKLGVKAGDLIDVTNSQYGYTNKMFRVITVEEVDNDTGSINLNITGLAYDANIYDFTTVTRQLRSPVTGIITKTLNNDIKDNNATASAALLFLPGLISYGANRLWDFLFPNTKKSIADALVKTPAITLTATANVCEGSSVTVAVAMCCPTCADFTGVTVPYTITGVASSFVGIPLTGNITLSATGTATLTIPTIDNGSTDGDRTMSIKVDTVTKTVVLKDKTSLAIAASAVSIVEGTSSTVTFTVTGVADGSKPYTITGSTSQVTTPLSGNVTISGGTGTLVINTTDIDAIADNTISINFDAGTYYCVRQNMSITITHTGTPPPTPPADTTCVRINVPYAWCPVYDGTTGQVKSITPSAYMSVEAPVSGGPTITLPTSLTVTAGSPSTVTIGNTVTVDATTTKPGVSINVVTSFNSIPVNGIVTGTLTTVRGIPL